MPCPLLYPLPIRTSAHYSDQGCLFLYATDTLWLKAGLEHVNGKIRVSCVVTDPYADWSVLCGTYRHVLI